jgi:pilus assembly protein CpaD
VTKNSISTVYRLAALAFAAILAACAPTPKEAQWSGAESPKETKVMFLRQTLDVHFDPGKDVLSATEEKRIADFVAREDIGVYDDITLASGNADARGSLATRRAQSVAAYLRTMHLKSAADDKAEAPSDQVSVVVGRYVVVPPNCPDWRKPSDDDPANTTSSNFGCATETNLGLMVADPRDLIEGKDPGPGDGEHAAYGVQRYRMGKVKMPHDGYESPDSFGPGTGVSDSSAAKK